MPTIRDFINIILETEEFVDLTKIHENFKEEFWILHSKRRTSNVSWQEIWKHMDDPAPDGSTLGEYFIDVNNGIIEKIVDA